MRNEAEQERYKKLLADYKANIWIPHDDWLWFWKQYKYDAYKMHVMNRQGAKVAAIKDACLGTNYCGGKGR